MKIVYQSIDGKVFDTIDEAIARDAFVELKEHLGEAPNYMPDYAKDALANYLIDLGYSRTNGNKTDLEKAVVDTDLCDSLGDNHD